MICVFTCRLLLIEHTRHALNIQYTTGMSYLHVSTTASVRCKRNILLHEYSVCIQSSSVRCDRLNNLTDDIHVQYTCCTCFDEALRRKASSGNTSETKAYQKLVQPSANNCTCSNAMRNIYFAKNVFLKLQISPTYPLPDLHISIWDAPRLLACMLLAFGNTSRSQYGWALWVVS